jgi:hypothetical protein
MASSKGSQACIDQTQPGDQENPHRAASEKNDMHEVLIAANHKSMKGTQR